MPLLRFGSVYNVVDDYFADSIDLLERELLKQVRMLVCKFLQCTHSVITEIV